MKKYIIFGVLIVMLATAVYAGEAGYLYNVSNPTSQYNIFGTTQLPTLDDPQIMRYRTTSVRQNGTLPPNGFRKLLLRGRIWESRVNTQGQLVCIRARNDNAPCSDCFATGWQLDFPKPTGNNLASWYAIGRHRVVDQRVVSKSTGAPGAYFYTEGLQSQTPSTGSRWNGNGIVGCINSPLVDYPDDVD